MTGSDAMPDTERQARFLLRIAGWVSVMDESGGGAAKLLERKAIQETLKRFSGEDDYRTLSPVFEYLSAHEDEWDRWLESFTGFTGEIARGKENSTLEFRQCAYDLAYCVAIRYRERNWLVAIMVSVWVSLLRFLSLRALHPNLPTYLSISAVEKNALNEIAIGLDLPQRVIE